jgi:tRNA-dihydrouridine synthase B
MAGVTDRPFRKLCKQLGAGYAVSEMVTSRRDLWDSLKTSRRANHDGETAPIAVQIAGTDPEMMADAARYNIDRGAHIIDINMGCPAKKVCNKWAGSALMQDERLALNIVQAVVAACAPQNVPVTLKMRTGWAAHAKNAPRLAQAAADAGVQMLTIHEHDTVAEIKTRVRVPVVANGDINTPEAARAVLAYTGADAVMIGRAAQGRPWIFGDIAHFLATGTHRAPPSAADLKRWMLAHLHEHYELYGEDSGVHSARKHLGWYVHALLGTTSSQPEHAESPTLKLRDLFRQQVNTATTCETQLQAVTEFFDADPTYFHPQR